jgi:hypothetical protein
MPQISSREEEPLPLEESCTLAVEPNTSYIATYALIFYLVIWGPAQLKGIVATFEDEAMVIRSLAVDSEAAKADWVLAIACCR